VPGQACQAAAEEEEENAWTMSACVGFGCLSQLVLVVALSENQQQQLPLSLDLGSHVIPRVPRAYIGSLDTDAFGLVPSCICSLLGLCTPRGVLLCYVTLLSENSSC
jgi:hypothetical protein